MKELQFRPVSEIQAHANKLSAVASDENYSDDTREQSFNQASMLMDIANGKWSVDDISEIGNLLQNKMDVSEYGYDSNGLLQGVDWVFGICEFKELSTTEEYLRVISDNENVKSVSMNTGGNPFIVSGRGYRHLLCIRLADNSDKCFYSDDIIECMAKAQEYLKSIEK